MISAHEPSAEYERILALISLDADAAYRALVDYLSSEPAWFEAATLMDTFLDQHLTKFIERLEEEAPESRSLAYAVMFSTAWDRLSPAVQRLVDLQRRLKVKFNVEV